MIFFINELMQKQQHCKQRGWPVLHISPIVLLYMLYILSSRHVYTMRAQGALEDLQVLVLDTHLKYISWEILWNCQQITRNLQAAMHLYQQSLR